MGVEDVDGQVGVRGGQLVVQFVLEGVVDRGPQVPAALEAVLEVVRGQLSRGRGRDLVEDVLGETFAEGAQAVDGARDAVEGYAFQAHFADQLHGLWSRRWLWERLGEVVEFDERGWRVQRHGRRRRDGKPRREPDLVRLCRLGDPRVGLADVGWCAKHIGLRVCGVDERFERR